MYSESVSINLSVRAVCKKNIFPNPPKIAIIKKNVVYAIELWAAAAQGKTKYTDEQAPGRDNIWNFKFAPEVRRT